MRALHPIVVEVKKPFCVDIHIQRTPIPLLAHAHPPSSGIILPLLWCISQKGLANSRNALFLLHLTTDALSINLQLMLFSVTI